MSLLTGRKALASVGARRVPVTISSIHALYDACEGISVIAVCICDDRLEWFHIGQIELEEPLPVDAPPSAEPAKPGERHCYCDPGCPGEPNCRCVPF